MERQFSPPRAGSYLPEHTVSSHKRNSAKYRMTLSTYVIAYFYVRIFQSIWTGIAQSVWRIATAWTVRGSNSDGSEIFCTRPDRPCIPPSPLWSGYRVSFLGLKRPGAWGWQSALIYRRGKKRVDLYLHFPPGPFVAYSNMNFGFYLISHRQPSFNVTPNTVVPHKMWQILVTRNSANDFRMRINTGDIFSGQTLLSVLCCYSVPRWIRTALWFSGTWNQLEWGGAAVRVWLFWLSI